MHTTLYYFSGSGNSLHNARRIAQGLGEAELVSIPQALREDRAPVGERIGFVFPTYAYGLPRMVREFVQTRDFPADAYLFAVASSFGIPGAVLRQLDRQLRKSGSRLEAGFCVLDERSSLIQDPDGDAIQRLMIGVNRGESPARSSERIGEIVSTVEACRPHRLERSNRITCLLGNLLNPLASSSFRSMARNFHSTGACEGCGTCAALCPRGTIRIEAGRPVWGAECEMCHACIQWCPQRAIEYGELSQNRVRYRHPEVRLAEMLQC